MLPSLFLSATSLLSVLAAVVFATEPARHVVSGVALALGLIGGFLLSSVGLQPDPSWTGALVIAAAAAHFLFRRGPLLSLFAAGILAHNWGALLTLQGLPSGLAIGAAVFVVTASAWFANRRADFVTPTLRSEAVLFVCVFAILVAAMPEVIAGWQAASVLNANATGSSTTGSHMPLLLPAICIGALVLGSVFSLWRRSKRC